MREHLEEVLLGNENYSLQIGYQFTTGEVLECPSLDIDSLAEMYPDCDIGY